MGNTVPSQDLLAMLASPDYSLRVKYLEGSVLVDSDLARADVVCSCCCLGGGAMVGERHGEGMYPNELISGLTDEEHLHLDLL